MNKYFLIFFLIFDSLKGFSQILDGANREEITLSKDKVITLYGEASSGSDAKSNSFYYLPSHIRLAQKTNGVPQFLFLNYTTENQGKSNSAGAILHMLMELGLTKQQETELQRELQRRHPGAILKGAAEISSEGEKSVKIISATLSRGNSDANIIHTGKAPTLPGSKYALAANFDSENAELFKSTLDKGSSIADLSLSFSYNYSVRIPAVKGYVIEDWSKLDSIYQKDSAYYSKSSKGGLGGILGAAYNITGGIVGAVFGFGWGSKPKTHYGYSEIRDHYRYLIENQIITFRYEENISDERTNVIREAFFSKFLTDFTSQANVKPVEPAAQEKKEIPNIKYGNSFTYKSELEDIVRQRRTRRFDLSVALSIKKTYEITENLASWYDNVKNNKQCVGEVLLSDNFFKHRNVEFYLDGNVNSMWGNELNFVSVDIRKKRTKEGSKDFSHQITFDKKYFDTSGYKQTVIYSKAESDEPDVFEYKAKWSFRGGKEFPINDTTWIKGRWQGVGLSPPIKPTNIKFEIDPEELKLHKIRNATLQVKYYKFGKEEESLFNLSPNSKISSLDNLIYIDTITQGYVHRLILYHEQKGQMALPWEPKINAINYVYAIIPEELKKSDQTFVQKVVEAAKTIKETGVLEKFKELIIKN